MIGLVFSIYASCNLKPIKRLINIQMINVCSSYSSLMSLDLVDETRSGVNVKLEIWTDVLEFEGFWLSRSKTKDTKK